jgi:hypothetical protein
VESEANLDGGDTIGGARGWFKCIFENRAEKMSFGPIDLEVAENQRDILEDLSGA